MLCFGLWQSAGFFIISVGASVTPEKAILLAAVTGNLSVLNDHVFDLYLSYYPMTVGHLLVLYDLQREW